MVSPNQKLADALAVLSGLQGQGRHIFRSSQFPREHRQRLLRNGYLRPVIKGWLMLSRPDALPEDTTAWHASFWEFCARYCSCQWQPKIAHFWQSKIAHFGPAAQAP